MKKNGFTQDSSDLKYDLKSTVTFPVAMETATSVVGF